MPVKEQKKPPKEYFSETIKEAIDINRKVEGLLEDIFGEELEFVRKDKEMLEKEEEFLGKIEEMKDRLKEITVEAHVIEKAVKEKRIDDVKKLCNNLKQKISAIVREFEAFRSEEHAVEEKRGTEIKEIEEELKETTQAESLIEHLKALEERIASLAEKAK